MDDLQFACRHLEGSPAFTLVAVLTLAVSIAGPAWRAARIDPAVALRNN